MRNRNPAVYIQPTVAVLLASAASAMPAAAQENRLAVTANLNTGFDTNILRTNERTRAGGDKDEYIVEPSLGIDYSRLFGRQRLFLTGTAGYSFHDRYQFLDRETLNLNGGANFRFGSHCQFDPTAALLVAQSDLENFGEPVKNTVTVQDYQFSAFCAQQAGIFPRVSGFLTRTENSSIRRARDQTVYGGEFALVYKRPSLGEIEASYNLTKIERLNRTDLTGLPIDDDTKVSTISVGYVRSVAARLSGRARVGYTYANPSSGSVGAFSGVSWSASATYEPSPRFGVSLGGSRGVSAAGNTGSSYYVLTEATLSASYKLSNRTNFGGNLGYARRQYRGEDRFLRYGPRREDRVFSAGASIGYRLNRRVGLNLQTRYRDRSADNVLYNYSTLSATLGVSVLLRR